MEILRQSSSTRENLGVLAVMEALEGQEEPTQRQIAQATGLNLKKVNYTLQKLLEKGYVKFQRARQNPNKRAYLYILTPSGLRMKSKLTYNFLKFTMDFYTRMEEKLASCVDEIEAAGVGRIVLYGASDVARILVGMIETRPVQVTGVVDPAYDGLEYIGCPVLQLDELARNANWDRVLVTTVEDPEEAERQLEQAGVSADRIWKLA
jgi:DNA-binding MarR family transcriptional regulator